MNKGKRLADKIGNATRTMYHTNLIMSGKLRVDAKPELIAMPAPANGASVRHCRIDMKTFHGSTTAMVAQALAIMTAYLEHANDRTGEKNNRIMSYNFDTDSMSMWIQTSDRAVRLLNHKSSGIRLGKAIRGDGGSHRFERKGHRFDIGAPLPPMREDIAHARAFLRWKRTTSSIPLMIIFKTACLLHAIYWFGFTLLHGPIPSHEEIAAAKPAAIPAKDAGRSTKPSITASEMDEMVRQSAPELADAVNEALERIRTLRLFTDMDDPQLTGSVADACKLVREDLPRLTGIRTKAIAIATDEERRRIDWDYLQSIIAVGRVAEDARIQTLEGSRRQFSTDVRYIELKTESDFPVAPEGPRNRDIDSSPMDRTRERIAAKRIESMPTSKRHPTR